MSAIIENLGGENRIVLDNSRFARPVAFMTGNSWQKIRIAMRLCMSDTGGSVSPCSFYVGICAGTSAIIGDPSAAHWFGVNFVGNFNTFGYATSPNRYQCLFAAGGNIVNGVLVSSSPADMETDQWQIGAGESNRTCLFVDILKGNPNYSCQYFRNTQNACTDVDSATFLNQALNDPPTIADHSFVAAQSWAANDTTQGQFTAVNISWNRTTPVFKISDLAVIQLA